MNTNMPYINIILGLSVLFDSCGVAVFIGTRTVANYFGEKRERLNKATTQFSTASLILRGSIVKVQVCNMCYYHITGFRDTRVTKSS